MQLPQYYTCKTKHHFRAQLRLPHMNENSSTKVNTILMKEFHLDTETSWLFITNFKISFRQTILTTKHIKISLCKRIGDYCLIRFCGSLWAFFDCGVTTTMLCNYYYKCNVHLQRGEGEVYSMQYAVNNSEVSAPVAPKIAKQRLR